MIHDILYTSWYVYVLVYMNLYYLQQPQKRCQQDNIATVSRVLLFYRFWGLQYLYTKYIYDIWFAIFFGWTSTNPGYLMYTYYMQGFVSSPYLSHINPYNVYQNIFLWWVLHLNSHCLFFATDMALIYSSPRLKPPTSYLL